MKLRHSLSIFGLVTMLGLGVGVGLASGQKPVAEAKAEIPTTVYLNWTNSGWASWKDALISDMRAYFFDNNSVAKSAAWPGNTASSTTTVEGVQYCAFNVPEGSTKVVFNLYHDGWDNSAWSHKTEDLVLQGNGKNLFATAGQNANDTWYGSWSVYGGTKYTVTKTAVEFNSGGVATGETWTLGSPETLDSGDTIAIPSPAVSAGYFFDGWYLDEACTDDYEATTLTGNLTLYAKLRAWDSWIYYVTNSNGNVDPTLNYIYMYDNTDAAEVTEPCGAWPGTAITSVAYAIDVTNECVLKLDYAHYASGQRIYKIPVPSATAIAKLTIVLNDNNAAKKQTLNIGSSLVPFTRQVAYYVVWDDTTVEYDVTKYGWSESADAAAAITLLVDIETARNAVTAEGDILTYSICGISGSAAAGFYNRYLALTEKAMVDSAYTYTYNLVGSIYKQGDPTPSQANMCYRDIMQQLRAKAVAEHQTVNDARATFDILSSESGNQTLLIVIIASSIAVLALIGGYFYFRKRKEDR